MRITYSQLCKQLPTEQPSAGLLGCIINKIDQLSLRRARQKAWAFSLMSLVSVATTVITVKLVITDISNSGFFSYLSLIWSDKSIIANYWQDFALSLLETLPATSLILVLGALVAGLSSLKAAVANRSIVMKFKNS